MAAKAVLGAAAAAAVVPTRGQPLSKRGRDISNLVDKAGHQLLPSTCEGDFCVTDWTDCEVTGVEVPVCDGTVTSLVGASASDDKREHAFYLITYSAKHNGWHGAHWYLYQAPPFSLSALYPSSEADEDKGHPAPSNDDDGGGDGGGDESGHGSGGSGSRSLGADDDGFAAPSSDGVSAPHGRMTLSRWGRTISPSCTTRISTRATRWWRMAP